MAKDAQKHQFFLSQSRKAIPKLERRIAGVHQQIKLMIDMSNTPILDASTLLREANKCASELTVIDKDLRQVIGNAHKSIQKLPREDKAKAKADFRGMVKRLETKFMTPAAKSAGKLYQIAKAKDTHPANVSDDPLIIILRVMQAFLVLYKYFSSETKKL